MRSVCLHPVRALPLVLALVGCVAGDDDGPADDGPADDGSADDGSDDGSGDDGEAEPPPCVDPADRRGLSVTVSGQVVDHATGEPIAADVAFNTAWEVADDFPAGCDPLATFTTSTDGDGGFGPETVDVGTVNRPPVGIFMVSGSDVADTASDQTIICIGTDCDDLDHIIVAPTRDLADGWREQMEVDGMPEATTRGLVVFRFRETDGSPAEGVVPQTLSGPDLLRPDLDMRFLDDDGVSLAPPGTDATTASGIAIIAVPGAAPSDYVYGSREGGDQWSALGVLAPPGWLFLEDERPINE
ncbi:MAG TPA: hypothetical protein VK698_29145 [Kofleriaceae bacterium]|nr:hypothetical protein [Kofleriaceae bacterium]